MRKAKNPKIPDLRTMESLLTGIGRAVRETPFETPEALDAYLHELNASGKLDKMPPEGAREVAQDIIYRAWETEASQDRIALAERALAISPDCPDAYNLLAEEAGHSLEEKTDLYRKGVEAGERALGPAFFKENKGHFWGMTETRPYMRSKAGLAQCLWQVGDHESALREYYDLLRLNPGDNQGIRYVLLACLSDLGRYGDLEELMKRPEYRNDCAAEWQYTQVLLSFLRQGPSKETSDFLKAALEENRHVPAYLLGRKSIPRKLPDHITMGGEDEAYCCAANFLDAWKKVPGALDWLRIQTEKKQPPKVGRNEPCHCGSGKKFKKCCAT